MADPPPAAVQRAVDAANAHDLDAFLATFTPDGAVNDWGREFRGPAAIRGWSEAEFTGVAVTLAVTAVSRRGSSVVVVAQVGGGRLQRAVDVHLRPGPRRHRRDPAGHHRLSRLSGQWGW